MQNDGVREAAAALARARRVFVLTGAGMGVASGLKTFRGDGGYWRDKPVELLASRAGFESDPHFVWAWYNERFAAYAGAEPNAGHAALVELEQCVPAFFLATQNVDGLHRRAGSRALVELHGDLQSLRCTGCAYRERLDAPFDVARPRARMRRKAATERGLVQRVAAARCLGARPGAKPAPRTW